MEMDGMEFIKLSISLYSLIISLIPCPKYLPNNPPSEQLQ
jgi:hypothetical protein